MVPSLFVIKMVSADCSTAQESLRKDSSATCCCCCVECRFNVQRIVRNRLAPVSCDFSTQSEAPACMISRDCFFISMLGQHNERDSASRVQEFREKFCGIGIPSAMLKQNQPVMPQLQHRFRLIQGPGVVQFRRQHVSTVLEDFANEKKIFLKVPDQ